MPIEKKILYKSISLFLKVLIATGSLWYIYLKVFQQNNFKSLFLFNSSKIYLLILTILLMFVNWSLEAAKWKMLVSRIENQTFFQSLKGVLCGLSVSVFTPNRVGEFSGRIFLLSKANRIDATLLTFAGNVSQLFVTLLMPVISFLVWRLSNSGTISAINLIAQNESEYLEQIGILNAVSLVSAFSFILALCLILLIYLFRNKITNKYLQIVKTIDRKEWLLLLVLSFIRYLVFFAQFHFLLLLFDVNISMKNSLIMIPLVFYVITIIPTFTLTEVGVRSSAALFFFSLISTNSDGILSASLMLWIINLALPAVAGLLFVFQLKFFRKE